VNWTVRGLLTVWAESDVAATAPQTRAEPKRRLVRAVRCVVIGDRRRGLCGLQVEDQLDADGHGGRGKGIQA
jgi:hypothetical protein